MTSPNRRLRLPVALAALVLVAAAASEGQAQEIRFAEFDIFLEFNHTDTDLGLHTLLDGEPWRNLVMRSPDGSRKLSVKPRGTLRGHGLTELFFESAEPSFDELPPEEFFSRFPAGIWEVEGTTIEGDAIARKNRLRHVLAAPPADVFVSGVAAAENCDVEPLPVVSEPVVIQWDPVTEHHPQVGEPGAIEVIEYTLILEREEPTLLIISIELPPEVTMFEVPTGFTDLGDEFKFEIQVREKAGNLTSVESCFEIE